MSAETAPPAAASGAAATAAPAGPGSNAASGAPAAPGTHLVPAANAAPGSDLGPVRGRGLDAATPLLLLPVNIETRFVSPAPSSTVNVPVNLPTAGPTGGNTALAAGRAAAGAPTAAATVPAATAGGGELWVRIYPDQIAINSHQPQLTAQEIADGQSYWNAVWSAGQPPADLDAVKAPWRGLAALYGPTRAAWIALQTTPANLVAQPPAATAAGAAPSPAPVFPSLTPAAPASQQPATAALLPDAWTVVLVAGTATATFRGTPIAAALAVGLTPGPAAFPPGSPVDPGMQWLVDFDQALAAGMALKIPLTAAQRAAGFDRIFVYGTRTAAGAPAELRSLLDAHHYTDGFALVPQGSPTNNTADASSAFSRQDPDYEISFAVERQGPLNTSPTCDGAVFAQMLGLDPAALGHVRYADGTGAQSGADAVTALWPATFGYFLSQMMADVFTADQIESARQYVLANAIPRGAVPAFRTGQTPYGVAVVTSLARYKPAAGRAVAPTIPAIEAPLVDFVRRLWPNWLASSAGAPHMQRTGDPDQQLVQVLGMDASSLAFRARTVLGDDFLWNYLLFLKVPAATAAQWWTAHLAAGRQLLASYGESAWDPRVLHLGLAPTSFPLQLPAVQSGPLSETAPLAADADIGGGGGGGGGKKVNYIEWLRQASIDDIRAENYPGPQPSSLLYKILRQSVLLDYVTLAARSELAAGRLAAAQLRENEILGIPAAAPPAQPPVSSWELLARPSLPEPALSWADYLLTLDPPAESPFARLADLRASLDRLAALPTAELSRLLTEFLDSCSHRLDTWATAVANALLKRTRGGQNTGLHLGAFGWVEDVRPAPPPAPIAGAELTAVQTADRLRGERIGAAGSSLPVPVQPQSDNGGYIYAPSFEQARTAAILRSGYMTHKGTADEGVLALDISSDRVRKALQLLDGVREGQTLSALLGYLFEEGLHGQGLDKYIQPFRDRFPVVAGKLTPSSAPSEAVAASNVVDGVALRTAFDQNAFPAGQGWGAGLPAPGADQAAVLAILKTIDDYADALGDLSIAESVFQVVRGNFGRAGGLMDAISKGDRPPDPDVVTTPRGGLDLTHRVLLLFAGTPAAAPSWTAVPPRPRAAAEPWLDAWLGQLLPDPAQVACTVHYQLGGAAQSADVALLDLGVGPLDCLAMADAAEVPQQSELEQRILAAAALPAGATAAQIDYTAPAGSTAFPDFFYLVASCRSLLGAARAMAPQDLALPEKKAEDLGGAVDLADLRARAAAAAGALQAAVAALQAAAAGPPAPLRAALAAASYFGVPGSIPGSDAELPSQAAAVLGNLQPRLAQALAVSTATAAQADLLAVFTAAFGGGFTVLPRFAPPDAADLQGALAQSAALTAADPEAPARWLNQLTHVRPAITRLDEVHLLSQALSGRTSAPTPVLAQLPPQPADRWLVLPIDPSHPPPKGRVAFACFTQGDPTTQVPFAGLLVDEWPERIPTTDERAAVAFHYGEPTARAPQSLLLAVCPDGRATWDDDLITGVLQETLELAKIRTVDLDSVLQVGQILPALYFAFNLPSATVSTSFITAKEVIDVSKLVR